MCGVCVRVCGVCVLCVCMWCVLCVCVHVWCVVCCVCVCVCISACLGVSSSPPLHTHVHMHTIRSVYTSCTNPHVYTQMCVHNVQFTAYTVYLRECLVVLSKLSPAHDPVRRCVSRVPNVPNVSRLPNVPNVSRLPNVPNVSRVPNVPVHVCVSVIGTVSMCELCIGWANRV